MRDSKDNLLFRCVQLYRCWGNEIRKMLSVNFDCFADSCGSGQCLENDYGIECLCPFGKAGKHCRQDIKIHVPAFTKNSYLAYLLPLLNEK